MKALMLAGIIGAANLGAFHVMAQEQQSEESASGPDSSFEDSFKDTAYSARDTIKKGVLDVRDSALRGFAKRLDAASQQAREQSIAFDQGTITIEENTTHAIDDLIAVVNLKTCAPATLSDSAQRVFNTAYDKDGRFILKIRALLQGKLDKTEKEHAQTCLNLLSATKPIPSGSSATHELFLAIIGAMGGAQDTKNAKKGLKELDYISTTNKETKGYFEAFHGTTDPVVRTQFATNIYEGYLKKYARYSGHGIRKGSMRILIEDVLNEFLAGGNAQKQTTLSELCDVISANIAAKAGRIMKSDGQTVDFQLLLHYIGKRVPAVQEALDASTDSGSAADAAAEPAL
jgi:hypothetical protein